MCSDLVPRLEYGRTEPHLQAVAGGVEARGGPVRLILTGSVRPHCVGRTVRTRFSVAAGETVEFALRYSPAFGPVSQPDSGEPTIEDTLDAWESWAALHTSYEGCFPAEVRRSSLILQGLTYRPSGAVVAAATTSLPERLGGALNFDYRFAWLRDLSLTIRSLWIAAPDEPRRLFDWFANSAGRIGDELVQIMYGVEGERDLTEHVLEHLSGYRDSRPVRVGNEAWAQEQLDVLGEVLDAAHLLADSVGEFDGPVQDMLVTLADRAADGWSAPDAGMWEARDQRRQYVSSKVMCGATDVSVGGFMIMNSFALDALTCGYSRDAIICPRSAGVFGGAARCGGQAPACPPRWPGGAVEARRSRVARAPSRSDAEGALDLGGTAPQAARHRRRHPQKRHKSQMLQGGGRVGGLIGCAVGPALQDFGGGDAGA